MIKHIIEKSKEFIEKQIPFGKIPKKYKNGITNFRFDDFDCEADYKIISLGCSWVWGVGLESKDLFHNIIKEKIENYINKKVVNWNLGSSGASNDYISRIFSLCIPVLKPDLVLVNFTHLSRRECFYNGEQYFFLPLVPFGNECDREVHENMLRLTNDNNDQVNFFNNYKTIEMLCRVNKLNFLYSCMKNNATNFKNDSYVGIFEKKDVSSDQSHPGKLSNQIISEKYWSKLMENKYLEKYK